MRKPPAEGLAERLKAFSPTLIVLEATGGHETLAVATLAKTDRLDARGLALFAQRLRPAVRPPKDAQSRALDALFARRRQIGDVLTMERNRSEPRGRTGAQGSEGACPQCHLPLRTDLQSGREVGA